MQSPPLIITLKLDDASHSYFTNLRHQHFPMHYNYLQAHLTLFHHLPANNILVTATLQKLAERQVLDLEVTGIKNTGNGVAFTINSGELKALHTSMQQCFSGLLISQDRHALWPHITVQNKVTAFKAKQTFDSLSAVFKHCSIKGIGFSSWLYLKGPWEHREDYMFTHIL